MQSKAGFQLADGVLVVTLPLCPGIRVVAARAVVTEEGPDEGNVLWEATDPVGEAAAGGEFRVGVPNDFDRQVVPLTTRLPDRFAVRAVLVAENGDELSMTRVATLSDIANFEPDRSGEFYTRGGEGMTREEINTQAHCGRG